MHLSRLTLIIVAFFSYSQFVWSQTSSEPVNLSILKCYTKDKTNNDRPCLAVATYNVQGLRNIDGLRDNFEKLNNIQVWAFQEINVAVGGATSRSLQKRRALPAFLKETFPEPDWHNIFIAPNPVSSRDSSTYEGQAIVSKFPIHSYKAVPLRATLPKKRFALACCIQIGSKRVLVINTDHEVGFLRVGPGDRQKQIDDLLSYLGREEIGEPDGIVVLGDFNTSGDRWRARGIWPYQEVALLNKCMGTGGLQSLPDVPIDFRTHKYTRKYFSLYTHLDHIFYRDIECIEWGTMSHFHGSDHNSLWAKFALGHNAEDRAADEKH
ncbi:MAG: endonuclease/exonuclease/phosphatase family protein [Planctomycetota bacterium]|jgi:endonuclease/exonuclease/phosphatase family metal-dependent hydrolase